MVNINNIMKQAQEVKKKMEQTQQELSSKEYEGLSGGGLVKVIVTGKGIVKNVDIDKSLLKEEEKEILEDLIVAAASEAKRKSDEESNDSMEDALKGMGLPSGVKFPF